MTDCPFCAIVRGEADADIVGRGQGWVAFVPLHPATPGHTLVIPTTHVEDLWRADDRVLAALASAAVRVGRAIGTALHPEGMNLITSAGDAAEQTVFHLHLHVVPRWPDDDMGPIWPPKVLSGQRSDPGVVERIRRALTDPTAR